MLYWNPLLLLLSCILLQLLQSRAYDIGCIWPPGLKDDVMELRYEIFKVLAPREDLVVPTTDISNPVTARQGLYQNGCASLCLAFHDPDVLDPFTMQPTFVTVPTFGRNAYSITMCSYQCMLHIYEDSFTSTEFLFSQLRRMGLAVTYPSERIDIATAMDILDSQNSNELIMNILEDDDYHPFTMGHIVGIRVNEIRNTDGFNEKGATRWCSVQQREVPCTASCRNFEDTVGYNPVPDPRIHTFLSSDTDKYNCTGFCRHWQPQESINSELGTITREKYSVPHIGTKARIFLRNTTVTLEDPNYNYHEEALLVVERLRETSSDPYKKTMIKTFHGDKGLHGVRAILQHRTAKQFVDVHSYQDNTLLRSALSIIEYESIIHVWREKVHHDLVRPTTVIKQWGNDVLDTFSGDPVINGSKNISARDFEAFLPFYEASAEFPSETSCFCTALMEFMDLYTTERYGETLNHITDNFISVVFADMEEFRELCSSSQLWAGFHFPASVVAGEEKCSGLGVLAAEYVNTVRNNSTFNGGWYNGNTLPACPLN